jgi:hypothetical protein
MAERKKFDKGLINVGDLITNKRKALGSRYSTRSNFIETRSQELFSSEDWISLRHLANIETGKNWISIEKLLLLATALEEDPVDLFEEIITAYKKK